jgi:hypothetical protein
MAFKYFPLFYSSVYASLLVSFVSISEYPLFQHSLGLSSGSRSFFSVYRMPELVISCLTLALSFLCLCRPFSRTKFFPTPIRKIALLFLLLLFFYSVVSFLQSTDIFQSLLTSLTLSIIPVTVYISGPVASRVSAVNILNKYSFVLYISLMLSFSLFLVSTLLLGNGISGRLVLRSGPSLVLASTVIVLLLFYLTQRYSLFQSPLVLLQFSGCLVFTVLGGSRGTLIALIQSLFVSFFIWLVVSRFKVMRSSLRRTLVVSILAFPFILAAFLLFGDVYSRPDSQFFADSYRQEQLHCLLASIQKSPLFGHGLASIPFCWDRYSTDVTRVLVELEFLNIYNQIGILLFLYVGFLILVSFHLFTLAESNRHSPIFLIYLLPAVFLLMLIFSSFFSGSIISFSNQFLVAFTILSVPLAGVHTLPPVSDP